MEAKLTKTMLTDYSKQYIKNGTESVLRNNHMNDLSKKDKITQNKIDKVINSFLKKIISIQDNELELMTSSKITLLESLTEEVSKKKKKKKRDAILVDFVNFIGIKQGVDYALYTSDLETKRIKEKQ